MCFCCCCWRYAGGISAVCVVEMLAACPLSPPLIHLFPFNRRLQRLLKAVRLRKKPSSAIVVNLGMAVSFVLCFLGVAAATVADCPLVYVYRLKGKGLTDFKM